MLEAVDAELGGVLVGEGPADVVVAAHVVHPGRAVRDIVAPLERLGEQRHVAGGQRLPDQRHLQRVVGELALGGVDVLGHLVGVHDRLGLEQQRRRGQPAHGVERLQQQVGLGQVLAGRAELLPDEGDGVHPQNVHALVGQEQHLAGHGPEDVGVGVVQVPLEGVERGPDPAVRPASRRTSRGGRPGRFRARSARTRPASSGRGRSSSSRCTPARPRPPSGPTRARRRCG